jgi:hypothetical protein
LVTAGDDEKAFVWSTHVMEQLMYVTVLCEPSNKFPDMKLEKILCWDPVQASSFWFVLYPNNLVPKDPFKYYCTSTVQKVSSMFFTCAILLFLTCQDHHNFLNVINLALLEEEEFK